MYMVKRGEITVFLSLIFILVLAFILSLAESARLQGVRMQLQVAADAACESAFAAYDRKLLDEFEVFFFDGSGNYSKFNENNLVSSIECDMNEIICPEQLYDEYLDFYKITLKESNLESVALATDDSGMVYREQAVMSMEGRYGIEYAKKILEESKIVEGHIDEGKAYEEEERMNQEMLVSLEEQKKQIDSENSEAASEAAKIKNPATVVTAQKNMGLLQCVLPDSFNLSQNQIVLEELPCKRTLNKGSGLSSYSSDFLSNFLFNEYLMQMFGNAADNTTNEGQCQYQIEYLLAGKSHDVDNLKSVVEKLLLIREGVNFAYILTDAAKTLEAETLALALVGYTALPILVEATKYAILLSWALSESMLDIKRLLAGKKVSIIKNSANWQLGLNNIDSLAGISLNDDSDGIIYEHYLRLMLLIQNQKTTASRCIDLVEMKMRADESNKSFRLDNMVCQFQIDIKAETESLFYTLLFMKNNLWNGKNSYGISRNFSYAMWK